MATFLVRTGSASARSARACASSRRPASICTITLKPGMLVHVLVGVAHGIKAEGGELTLVDFAQAPFDPDKNGVAW